MKNCTKQPKDSEIYFSQVTKFSPHFSFDDEKIKIKSAKKRNRMKENFRLILLSSIAATKTSTSGPKIKKSKCVLKRRIFLIINKTIDCKFYDPNVKSIKIIELKQKIIKNYSSIKFEINDLRLLYNKKQKKLNIK